ncbi:MAG TPA: GIY-YIG nuclease family protein [Candidatus Acidoferrales bacterium]|nr:GIY-YIG nuclease family protein [Candidatus Acidoferrales bacterium]
MGQTLLFPDPKPLDQRLGRGFFQKAPQRPGVYLMKDAADRVLYVGKARNLRQRLNHYRLANPDRMPRRHLRMVRQVQRIEFQLCANEAAALRRESKLLRLLRPRFNRAGVWPGKARFVAWRVAENRLELGVVEVPEPGWHRYGPLNGSAHGWHRACARLLWLALNGESSVAGLPAGWATGNFPQVVALQCGCELATVLAGLNQFFWGDPAALVVWLGVRLASRSHAFERAVIAADLESLHDFSRKQRKGKRATNQLALL